MIRVLFVPVNKKVRFMKYLLIFVLIFGLNSKCFSQNCATGNCQNHGTMAGPLVPVQPRQPNFNPPPRPSEGNTTQYPNYYPPVNNNNVIAGKNGKDGVNGKDGRDGKDVDPALLNSIKETLVKIDNQLQDTQKSYQEINQKLVSLEKNFTAMSANSNNSIETIKREIETLNKQMAGSLRVRFKYDPKTDSLTRLD